MNQPKARNAMTGFMMDKMREALPRLAADSSVRCVVLTEAGKAFCAGGDVKGFASAAKQPKNSQESGYDLEGRTLGLRTEMELSRLLHEMLKPTLAAIPGPAAGGGLSLALGCDLRVVVDDAKSTTAFSKVGLSGDNGRSLSETFDREAQHMMRCFMTQDHKRAAQAFGDKTSPEFLGS